MADPVGETAPEEGPRYRAQPEQHPVEPADADALAQPAHEVVDPVDAVGHEADAEHALRRDQPECGGSRTETRLRTPVRRSTRRGRRPPAPKRRRHARRAEQREPRPRHDETLLDEERHQHAGGENRDADAREDDPGRGPQAVRRRMAGDDRERVDHHHAHRDPGDAAPEDEPDRAGGRDAGEQAGERDPQARPQQRGLLHPAAEPGSGQRPDQETRQIERRHRARFGGAQPSVLDQRGDQRGVRKPAEPHAHEQRGRAPDRKPQPCRHRRSSDEAAQLNIVFGRISDRPGKATRIARQIIIAAQNGRMPI